MLVPLHMLSHKELPWRLRTRTAVARAAITSKLWSMPLVPSKLQPKMMPPPFASNILLICSQSMLCRCIRFLYYLRGLVCFMEASITMESTRILACQAPLVYHKIYSYNRPFQWSYCTTILIIRSAIKFKHRDNAFCPGRKRPNAVER
jgi:hypothetical protein